MPKRTICIQNSAYLSTEHSSLVIESGESNLQVPLEDIWVLILETHRASITSAALSAICESEAGVLICGNNHMPNGMMLPLDAHTLHSAIVDKQLSLSKPQKKRLWQKIVQAKIANQARVLELLGHDASKLKAYASEVPSGDTSNRESAAAAHYFKTLLPYGGRHGSPYSAALDYGYTVLRAGVGRATVSGGWLASHGLHHESSLNSFNLVDDLIEPFRPVIDLLVLRKDIRGDLTPDSKRLLASVFEYQVSFNKEKMCVQSAIEAEVHSLKRAVESEDYQLLELPEVIELQTAAME